jgi:hypothetical protein
MTLRPQILCIIPSPLARWLIVFSGGLVASLFLILNLRRLLEGFEDTKRKSFVLLLAGAAQVGLALALVLLFFSYPV